jgi:hypothetical protein
MKKLLVILLVLTPCWCWSASAVKTYNGVADGSVKTLVGVATASAKTANGVDYNDGDTTCADSSCTGFLVCQNFEGSGTDNSETWTDENGSPNRDYTTEALRGTQSVYLVEYDFIGSNTFTASGEIWLHFILQVNSRTSSAADKKIIYLNTTDLYIGLSEYGGFIIGDGTRYDYGSGTFDVGTNYHVWLYYKKVATSGDGIMRLYFGTDRTIPGTADAEFTNGVSTTDISKIYFHANSGQGISLILDQVLVKTAAISPVCE